MAEVKQALKDAKKAMKDNNFEEVSNQCKIVLKHDRKNYNALVYFGRACQELGKMADSKKVLTLATQVEPDNPVAWMGLKALCEKQPNITTKDETITIYTRVKEAFKNDIDKLDGVYRKIASIYMENDEPVAAATTLRELVDCLSDSTKVYEAWKSITQILLAVKKLSDEEASKLEESLEHVLNESVLSENENNYQSYLRLLYRTKKFIKLVKAAEKMLSIFCTYYPLEWLCRVYVEMNAFPRAGDDSFPLTAEEIARYTSKLLSLNKASPWGNLAMGWSCQQEARLPEAKAYLRVGAERVGSSLVGWDLLLSLQEETHDWPGVEVSCKKSLAILSADANVSVPRGEDRETYCLKLRLKHAKALFHMGHDNHLRQAVAILSKEVGADLGSGIMLVRCRVKLREFEEANREIQDLEVAHGRVPQIKLLSAILKRAQGENEPALQLLLEFNSEEPNIGEGHLELGKLYFTSGDMKKAQICCMRAGKLDPSLGQAFLYLGHFFRAQDNTQKAVKCYEKALAIDPCDDDTGAALSDMYRTLGEHDANIQLLRRVTGTAGQAGCAWAWLRLGLHYLALHEYDKAIQAFHCTLAINPNDSASYECLGDAYLAYGAHTSALKVFTKASEINPDALYPLYQIAHIKQMVGEYLEAIDDYEAVLNRDPVPSVQVVALVGVAEAVLAHARKCYEQFFHINVKDLCQRAIDYLMRAASIKPESMSTWKLMGDACTLLFPTPASIAAFTVPTKLLRRELEDLTQTTQVDKVQVLQLGARCYGVALQIAGNDASLWHDLGVNTYLQGQLLEEGGRAEDEPAIKSLVERSLAALRKSLALDPNCGKIWNSLGMVAAHKAIGDLKLAQHALIKSTELQPTVVHWTHLGAFYLVHNEPQLAHKAFSYAQGLDPAFVTCWVGQALVAETVGHIETYDLFRHTTLLGIHAESCLGYAHHVTELACDAKKKKNAQVQEAVEQALPKVTDSLVFYTREKEKDIIGLNMAGLVQEMMGLHLAATKAYTMALDALSQMDQEEKKKYIDGVRCNLGRTLTAQGKVEEAMKQYSAIKEPDYFSQCGFALASLKAGKFEEAYNSYTAALHWLAPDDELKSHILVALATLQYKFQNRDETKKLLFQGSQLKNASVRGLFALAALGLITDDAILTNAALAELRPHEHNPEHLHHVAFLRAAEATAKGDMKEAKLILSRVIHQHPSSAPLWQSLARHLLTNTTKPTSSKHCVAAMACALAATKLAMASRQHKTLAQDSVAGVLATLGLDCGRPGQSKASLREAQRAVIMCPGSAEAWAMLIAARIAHGNTQNRAEIQQLAAVWSQQASPKVATWLSTVSLQLA